MPRSSIAPWLPPKAMASAGSSSIGLRGLKIGTSSGGCSFSRNAAGRCHSTSRRCARECWRGPRDASGPRSSCRCCLAEEGREVQAYLGLARHSTDRLTHAAAVDIAADSAMHARELSAVMGRVGEPWHTGGAGGYLRSVVYGFNDGLTANFGLVAGVIGAERRAARRHRQRHRRGDCRRAVDGRERLPGREERSGGAGAPDRDGTARDAADAGSRGRRAGGHLRSEGVTAGSRPRNGACR